MSCLIWLSTFVNRSLRISELFSIAGVWVLCSGPALTYPTNGNGRESLICQAVKLPVVLVLKLKEPQSTLMN